MHTSRPVTTRIGFELELLAPPGSSRRALADKLARLYGGHVERVFHVDSEPSLVPGMGQFWHLTPAYGVVDATGAELATLVDDVTLVADLHRERSAAGCGTAGHRPCPLCTSSADPATFRVLSDDLRLLRLAQDRIGEQTRSDQALDGIAAAFGVPVESVGPVRRVRDRTGAAVAMSTALAPGRERPCEIVTPPISTDHEAALEALLAPARALGFRVPVEAAVHLHLDGAPFRTVPSFAALVRLFTRHRDALHATLRTNPACVRIGALPPGLLDLVDRMTASGADWAELQQAARELGLTKYLDLNLTALLTDTPVRDTVEVRILPGALDGATIMRGTVAVLELLDACFADPPSSGRA